MMVVFGFRGPRVRAGPPRHGPPMLFRNLTLFRFSPRVADDLDNIEEALDEHRLRPCGPMEMSTRGFISPLGRDAETLTHAVGSNVLLAIGGEDKLLPSSVVNEELSRKVRQIAEDEGRKVSGRERKKIKEELMDQLLPRAFVRPSRHMAYADRKNGWLVLDTSSRKAAENSLTAIRDALGSFPATPLAPEHAPRQLMTDWLSGGELPAGLTLGDECELRDPANASGAVVRCRRQDLESDEIKEHLRGGKQVFQLGLNFDERMGFVLGEDLVLRKLKFFDVVTDELDNAQTDSAAAELDARFALMALELERLFGKLEEWFGLPRPTDG
jgi:recombination associated protein RdgC